MAIGFSTRSVSSKLVQLVDCFVPPVLQRSAPIQGFLVSPSIVFRVGEDEVMLDIAWKTVQHPLKTFSHSRVRAYALTRVLLAEVLLFKQRKCKVGQNISSGAKTS
jgi:hypothetical protein